MSAYIVVHESGGYYSWSGKRPHAMDNSPATFGKMGDAERCAALLTRLAGRGKYMAKEMDSRLTRPPDDMG